MFSVSPNQPAEPPRLSSWRLACLTLGNLIVATGATIVVGILPELVQGLEVSASMAGQLSTAYSLTACLLGPLLGGLTARFDRRWLLVAVLLGNALGNLLSALAPSYSLLLICRVLAAAFGVLHTSQAAVTVSLLVPPEHRGRGMSMVFLGVALSSVVGLPLGSWLAHELGWRATFAVLGGLGLLVALLDWLALPQGLRMPRMGDRPWGQILRHPLLSRVLLVSVLQFSGQGVLLAYMAVSYQWSVGADATTISLLLGVFGLAGVSGNLIASRLLDRVAPAQVQAVAIVTLFAASVLWWLARGSMPLVVLATVLWGLATFVPNTAQQVRLVALAAPLAPVTVALNTSAIMLGQSLGTIVGGFGLAWFNPGVLPLLGLPMLVAALWVSQSAHRAAVGHAGS